MKDLKKTIALFLAATCFSSFVACDGVFDTSSSEGVSGESTSSSVSSSADSSLADSSSADSVSSSNAVLDSSFTYSSSSADVSSDSASVDSSMSSDTEVAEELSIHFLQFDNVTSGDCALIKTGNTEVLIDAGSTTGSAATIVPYIQNYCTDGVLEYVIATHGDSDHISAFVGTEKKPGIFDSFDCEVIIDSAYTTKETNLYDNYVVKRDAEVAAGATHYTAIECWKELNGAKRSYALGQTITMEILYQKYYETKTSNENNYSVCVLFTQGEQHYLFTGDLEESGEKSLVESNNLPKCTLFKAGHHGSDTANTTTLLSVIQPEIVVACCCCGDKYNFPHQAFIDRVAPYTDRVYVPKNKNGLMNGNIVISSNGKTVDVQCSNNNTILKNTDWFQANRVMPEVWKAA